MNEETAETVPVPNDLLEPRLSENALVVLRRRYLRLGPDGEPVETPRELFWRVAWHVAQAEAVHGGDVEAAARDFYNMMARLEFLPASPTLMNAGRALGQLAACFVLPIEDSLDSIFDTLKHAAKVHQSGGGTGFDFSRLRPEGDPVKTTHGVSSGPLSFLRVYNAATEEIKQGGVRRGANMGVLRVDHPDILRFIDVKRDPAQIKNFNLSVAATEDFMDALARGGDYDLIHPATGASVGSLNARKVFAQIAEAAWHSGEPGLLFIDRANDQNPVQRIETISSTNPCGEQFLAPYDSCTLGSIDLSRHVTIEHNVAGVQWEKLRETVQLAVRFLDDVLDVQRFPVPEIAEKTLANRRIGLGIMGFARLLYRLGIAYDSEEGRDTATRVMAFIQRVAHETSEKLAEERGVFPNWEHSEWKDQGKRMRNVACTTIAPTGTIGMIADTSGGCEPEFSLVYVKRCLDGTLLPYVVPEVEQTAHREGWWRDGLLDVVADNSGSVQGIKEVPRRWQNVFVTAHDIAPEDHVRMQAAFQAHVDNAVSKTINLPKNAKPDDVEKAFRLAYELGCKGITVYREGSRPQQVLNLAPTKGQVPTGSLPEDGACQRCSPVPATVDAPGPRVPDVHTHRPEGSAEEAPRETGSAASGTQAATPRPRPLVTKGHTHKVTTDCGDLYVTIGEDDQGPVEVIAVRSRANACTSAHLEATSRLATLALRWGIPLEEVARSLAGVRCAQPHVAPYGIVHGCVDGIGQALERQALGALGPQHDVVPMRPLDSYHAEPVPVPRPREPEPTG